MLGVLRLYTQTAALAGRRAARAWPVAFSLVLYAVIVVGTSQLVAPLGRVGGFVLGFVMAGCFSSYIHLISQAVAGSRLRFGDLRQSFGARFWDVVSILFAFWVIELAVAYVIAPAAGPKADIVIKLAGLAMAVLFNPVPELLYQGSSRSFQLLFESGRFISKYGLEWLLPNVLAAAALMAPFGLLKGPAGGIILRIASIMSPNNQGMGLLGLFGSTPSAFPHPALTVLYWVVVPLLVLLFIHWLMVFRGLLFAELLRGSSRQRALRGGGWGR